MIIAVMVAILIFDRINTPSNVPRRYYVAALCCAVAGAIAQMLSQPTLADLMAALVIILIFAIRVFYGAQP